MEGMGSSQHVVIKDDWAHFHGEVLNLLEI
jgi:hypothetical protein